MAGEYKVFENQQMSHISNYSGVFDPDGAYEKFDFVYNTGDGLFYYAREDNVRGGGAQIEAANRFSLVPSGRKFIKIKGRHTNNIIDEYNQLDTLGVSFKEGQTIEINGSQEGSNGKYKIYEINKNFDIRIKSSLSFEDILGATEVGSDSFFEGSWFLKNNVAGSDNIVLDNFFWYGRDFGEWVYLFDKIYYQWLRYEETGGLSHPSLPKNLDVDGFGYHYYKSDPGGIDDLLIPISELEVSHSSFGLVNFSTIESSSKEINFYLPQVENLDDSNPDWFYTNQSLSSQGLAYLFDGGEGYYGPAGWTYWQRWPGAISQKSKDDREAIGVYNFTNSKWYRISNVQQSKKVPRAVQQRDYPNSPSVSLPSPPSVATPELEKDFRSKILIQGINDSTEIKEFEAASSNELSINILDSFPSDSPDVWSSDLFFFDADYGSKVSYKMENNEIEYGNGYIFRAPKSINGLSLNIDLNFKNRTNKESNAIIHFVENHQGQLERDSPTDYLKYSQGISGFLWAGESSFHPYDSLNSQTTRFLCDEVNHKMNFENSNDISLTLKNFSSSILNKSEGIFVKRADSYSSSEYYEYNDVVFSSGNHKYYYNISENPTVDTPPVESYYDEDQVLKFKDLNTGVWSREFTWKPSIGLDVNQKFYLSRISSVNGYSQYYREGINESLLELNLNFNSRDDSEAYAILHFLEDHLGFLPFIYSPPAPYDRKLNFICESWNHTYVYKNCHNISVNFKQIPFNYSAEKIDNRFNVVDKSPGQLKFSSPVNISTPEDIIDQARNFRHRIFFENIGDSEVNISSMEMSSHPDVKFQILGQQSTEIPLIVPDELNNNDYIFQLPSSNLPFDLNSKYIKLSKVFTNGPEGEISFRVMIDNGDGTFSEQKVGGNRSNLFTQRNDGLIYSSVLAKRQYCDIFIDEEFFKSKSIRKLKGGQKGFADIIYISDESLVYIVDNQGNNISNEDDDILITKRTQSFSTSTFNVINDGIIENLQGIVNISI